MERQFCKNDHGGYDVERTNRRVQNGVEIIERETMRTIRLEQGEYVNSKPIARLVIDDAIERSKNFISKSRSQFDELNAFLRTAVRRPADAK
jgi:hypothetical protein